MQVSSNPSKVVFYCPSNPFQDNQQQPNTRSSSFHGQKGVNPILIKDPSLSNFNQVINKEVKIPKKVSFHYNNGKQSSQNVLIYPPSFPATNNITEYSVENRKKLQSQYSRNSHESNDRGQRMRIHSNDQRSQASKNSVNNVVTNSTSYKKTDGMFINYPYNKSFKQLPNVVKNQQQFPRQRSQSVLSSKSSTKIILQSVRQVKPDGSKGAPVEIKQRIETQYLTTLNNNNRQNYHIISNQPKQVIINQQQVQSPQPFVRDFYSPQNFSTFSTTQHNQKVNGQFLMNQNKNQSRQNQLINVNHAKSSQVFPYQIKNSFDYTPHMNYDKIQRTQNNMPQQKHNNLKSLPVTSQSKFESTQMLESQQINANLNKNVNENNNLKDIHEFESINKLQYNKTQQTFLHKTNDLKDRNKSNYRITTQFYSVSQKMIDQIFRNQTQKAILRLNTIEAQYSPRKFYSPNIRRYNKN